MKAGRYGAQINPKARQRSGPSSNAVSARAGTSFVPSKAYGSYAQVQNQSAAQKLHKAIATSTGNRAATRKPTLPTFKCLEEDDD